jgi:hypothetical protein
MGKSRQIAEARSAVRHKNWKKKKQLKKEQEKYYTPYVELIQQQKTVNLPYHNINRQLSACSNQSSLSYLS